MKNNGFARFFELPLGLASTTTVKPLGLACTTKVHPDSADATDPADELPWGTRGETISRCWRGAVLVSGSLKSGTIEFQQA
ncbi:MAG TPA: hypothetical protein VHM67_07450 [Gemmatimonadaceae bacterium]|nr:hypothetical protein [Gemmatimonadaceae bacterium]